MAANSYQCSGKCCERITLGKGLTRPEFIGRVIRNYAQDGLQILGMLKDTDDPVVFECKNFDTETRKCTDYENRPRMCREYPYGNKCNKEGCEYKDAD